MSYSNTDSIYSYTDRQVRWWSEEKTVQEIFETFRSEGLPHKIMYLYIADSSQRLKGVVPVRRLLSAQPQSSLKSLMITEVNYLFEFDSVNKAKKAFADLKFLAFPVVDKENKLVGVLDIEKFSGDLGKVDERKSFDDVYELLGFKSTDAFASRWIIVKRRAFWMSSTFICGILSAFFVSHFHLTLQNAIELAFYLTLVLALNESIAMQSTGIAIQKLHNPHESKYSMFFILKKEFPVGLALGFINAVVIGIFSYLWHQSTTETLTLSLSIFLTNIIASLVGSFVPHFLHLLKWDAKIAAAPIALGIIDIITIFLYLSLGTYLM